MRTTGEIWSLDSEWGFTGTRIDNESAWVPVVLCAVGLKSGRRVSFWGRDAGIAPFFAEHAADLFLAHNAVAEMKYLLRLGVPLPQRWYDTYVAWRYSTNRPRPTPPAVFAAVPRFFTISPWLGTRSAIKGKRSTSH